MPTRTIEEIRALTGPVTNEDYLPTLEELRTLDIPEIEKLIILGAVHGPLRANRELEMDLGEEHVFLVRYGKTEYVVGRLTDGTYEYKLRNELPLGFHLQDYPVFDITKFKEIDEEDESMNGFLKAFENFCKSHRATKIQTYLPTRIENN